MQNISYRIQDQTGKTESINIRFTSCAECPYVARTCNHSEYICNHPKRVAFKPYCNDRLVNPTIIDRNCPLQIGCNKCGYEICICPKPKCDCHLHERQVCDVCQGVTGKELDKL